MIVQVVKMTEPLCITYATPPSCEHKRRRKKKKRERGREGEEKRNRQRWEKEEKITSGCFCWLLLPKKKYKKIIAQRSTHTRSGILGENTAVKGGG